MIPVIDTHQHLIMRDRWPYTWADNVPALQGRSFTLDDYQEITAGLGIEHTLFMETSPDAPHGPDEARVAARLSEQEGSSVIGIITGCRPEREDFVTQLQATDHPHRVGVRRTLHTTDDALSQGETFRSNIRRLAEHDLTFDLCINARQHALAIALIDACPDVQFVLDHCGNPDIAHDGMAQWQPGLQRMAERPNVACKISGILANCRPEQATLEGLLPYLEITIAAFGWDRVVWGSDWPVCNLSSSLPEWLAISRAAVSSEDDAVQRKLFFDNARKIYGPIV